MFTAVSTYDWRDGRYRYGDDDGVIHVLGISSVFASRLYQVLVFGEQEQTNEWTVSLERLHKW
jgi:hypothetical protein